MSRRYVDSEPEFWMPDFLRQRDSNKKQGSKEEQIEDNDEYMSLIQEHAKTSVDIYNSLLKGGVCPEQARTVLPQSMITEFIETGSLAAYARLYKLRNYPSAQKEIRDYASQLDSILSEKFPVSWKALTS